MRGFDYRALGRLKAGQMNRTEAAYATYLEGLKHAGDILWWRFEGIKLRLADRTFITIDFAVLQKNLELELHDVKGFMTDETNAKLKVAADQYPIAIKVVRRIKGGAWEVQVL